MYIYIVLHTLASCVISYLQRREKLTFKRLTNRNDFKSSCFSLLLSNTDRYMTEVYWNVYNTFKIILFFLKIFHCFLTSIAHICTI